MGVRRVMGIETEYGIAVVGNPAANAMLASGEVVAAYAQAHGLSASHGAWDYQDEAPLQDARGFTLARPDADPSQLTDEFNPSLTNLVLPNGARLYVDHAHPEYSSPEVTSPLAAISYDRAGQLVMAECVNLLNQVNLYKNNVDGKGASYGTHENYLLARAVPFADLVIGMTPFLVTRQILCGSGRVGIGASSQHAGYQLSQRADYIEAEVGLETTWRRPIINTRDEPHADPKLWRRLHLIIGDANLADVSNLLKLGTTSLILELIEAGVGLQSWALRNPVGAVQAISHDPSLQTRVELLDGRQLRAIDVQWGYYEAVVKHQERLGIADAHTSQVLYWWEHILSLLSNDPLDAAEHLDWVAKLALLSRYRERGHLGWEDPRLRALDIQWSDVRPSRSVFTQLEAAGSITVLTDPGLVATAVSNPPVDTRAWFRGSCVDKFGEDVISASWDSVVLRTGSGKGARVRMLDPLGHDQAAVGTSLAAGSVDELLHHLGSSLRVPSR